MTEKRKTKTELSAHGVRCLLAPDPRIRRLKQRHRPNSHGGKVWKTSWMLMDYLSRNGTVEGGTALDIGCGWGLTGIFLARRFNARVTGVDIDPEIEPYLKLHADINRTSIRFLNKTYEQLRAPLLRQVDMMVGTDICFWEELVDPLRKLINRARRAGVKKIFLADPGRQTFQDLSEYFVNRRRTQLIDWEIEKPVYATGKILSMDFQTGK